MTVTVRCARPEDVADVRFVGLVAWPATYGPLKGRAYVLAGLDEYWNAEAISAAIQSGDIDVAEEGGEIIGMTHVEALGEDLVMWKLYVLPDQQHRGVGRSLVDAAKARARARGGDLVTEFEPSNEKVRGFYQREGFDTTAAPWPGTDAVWLRWRGDARLA
ncbi:MAG: GNAT family N-acetyltransferase [Pseudoclavibacter sp.]